jgi:hypothetical protein
MAVPATGLNVGLLALTDHSPDGGDRLQTLPMRSSQLCAPHLEMPASFEVRRGIRVGGFPRNWT